MLGFKLSIIILILFCSLSIILYSEQSENLGNNDSTNYANEKQPKDSNYDFTDSPFFKIGIVIISLFLGIIVDRISIRYGEKRDAKKEFRQAFHSLIVKININEVGWLDHNSSTITKHIVETDTMLENLKPNISVRKSRKIICAYEAYKKNATNEDRERFGKTPTIYDIDADKMKEIFGDDAKFNTGKDLCLHDIQNIINLAK